MSNCKVHILTEDEWVSRFSNLDFRRMTYNSFFKRCNVRKGNNEIVSFTEYCKSKKIPEETLRFLYEFVKNKEGYLVRFFKTSLKIHPINYTSTELSYSNNINKNCKNLIRNIYYKEILNNTSTIQPNIRTYMKVIDDLFNHLIFDYKILTPSVLQMIMRGEFGSILSGLYFRASIMNPFLVYSLTKMHMCSAKRVFTPTLGWSSYAVGMCGVESVSHYVGVDVIPKVCSTTIEICKCVNPKMKVETYCQPSETLVNDQKFLKKFRNYFDTIFFSPPYYEYELYQGNSQSTKTYKTYDSWLLNYWEPTIKLCSLISKKNGMMCYIVSKYKINNKVIDLPKDMNKITEKYFRFIEQKPMKNTNVSITKHRDTNENAYFFVLK